MRPPKDAATPVEWLVFGAALLLTAAVVIVTVRSQPDWAASGVTYETTSVTVSGKSASTPSGVTTSTTHFILVNINAADVKELMKLEGVDRALAERIIAYRKKNGLYLDCRELLHVSGFTQEMLDRLWKQLDC